MINVAQDSYCVDLLYYCCAMLNPMFLINQINNDSVKTLIQTSPYEEQIVQSNLTQSNVVVVEPIQSNVVVVEPIQSNVVVVEPIQSNVVVVEPIQSNVVVVEPNVDQSTTDSDSDSDSESDQGDNPMNFISITIPEPDDHLINLIDCEYIIDP